MNSKSDIVINCGITMIGETPGKSLATCDPPKNKNSKILFLMRPISYTI